MTRSERPTDQHFRFPAEKSTLHDGRWVVIDTFTGWPALVRGIPLDGLPAYEANDLAVELNERDTRGRELLRRFLD